MTTIRSFLRIHFSVSVVVLFVINAGGRGETIIRVGHHDLLPNTPGQLIDILVEGNETVAGIDLFAQVGDGGPGLSEFGLPAGTTGPTISDVDFSASTVFENVEDEAIDLGSPSLPQTAVYSLALLGPTREVRADGVLFSMTIDTRGIFDGEWSFQLANVLPYEVFGGPYDTNFANSKASDIENGTIEINSIRCDQDGDQRCDPLGDFNGDGRISTADIDSLHQAIRFGVSNLYFDINFDGSVSIQDRDVWVRDIRNTFFGDANLDNVFDSGDFVLVFQSGLYEDDVVNNATWETGDWDGDGDFTSGDFVLAFQDGGYEIGPKPVFVPEPSTTQHALALAIACSMICSVVRKYPRFKIGTVD